MVRGVTGRPKGLFLRSKKVNGKSSIETIGLHDRNTYNRKITLIKVTHKQATVPMGTAHFPRLKGPGTKDFRPIVIRQKIGML
jgi:hypothetical protein